MRFVQYFFSILSLLSFSVLSGCGGGGGGEGGGSKSSATGIRILHGSLNAPPLDLTIDTDPKVRASARFSEGSVYGSVSPGAHTIHLKVHGTAQDAYSFPLAVERNERFSVVVASPDPTSSALQGIIVQEKLPEQAEGKGYLRLINGVTNSSELRLFLDNNAQTGEIPLGKSTRYVEFAPGAYTFSVRVGDVVLAETVVTIESGKGYSLFASGEAGYFVGTTVNEDF